MSPTRSRSKAAAKSSATSLPALSVIPAGAGSGKTYHIQHQLGEWIASGQVVPERIVAVTFTEAAAAELRARISANLLASGQTEAALRLDQAYISTIHAFGLRILSEFAFEAGTSPQPRQLSEDEQSALLRRALPRTDKADVLIADLARFGYKFDYNSGKGPEDRFRDDLLRVIELLRALGWQGADDRYAEASGQWIAQIQGKATQRANARAPRPWRRRCVSESSRCSSPSRTVLSTSMARARRQPARFIAISKTFGARATPTRSDMTGVFGKRCAICANSSAETPCPRNTTA
jgi:ATP-dependent exoDNAse (exonuclease V) beta subunit